MNGSIEQSADGAFDAAPIARPAVAGKRRGGGMLGYGVICLAGAGVLAVMVSQRNAAQTPSIIPASNAAPASFARPEPLPADANATGGAMPGAMGDQPALPAPQFTVDNQGGDMPVQVVPMPAPGAAAPTPQDPANAIRVGSRQASPAMVVDLSAPRDTPAAASGTTPANPALAGQMRQPDARSGSGAGEAEFLQNVSARPETARATRMGKLDTLVSEGAILSATLETAINSDLPGFARAVISRDVPSFDGSRVLIPRGSRVIGQYKSGVSLGASRVFVIWTRLIRPDGVSIQLVSPGGDDLGRGGLSGKVNRHFFQRFGGSILTSVLSGALNLGAAALGGSQPIVINSVAEAGAAANSALQSRDVPPTVKTQQGASVKIFVARDLDFAGMERIGE